MYEVRFYTGNYNERQQGANRDQVDCYVEHHFNSTSNPGPNYAMAIVPADASALEMQWARDYTARIARALDISDKGAVPGGYDGRGGGNIDAVRAASMLVEPCFISNKKGAEVAREHPEIFARALVESIRQAFPPIAGRTRLIGFSIGHVGKRAKPNDRGAQSILGDMESDLATVVLHQAAGLLQRGAPSDVSPWAREAYEWAIERGISDGTRPRDPVTREEAWVMLHRLHGLSSGGPT